MKTLACKHIIIRCREHPWPQNPSIPAHRRVGISLEDLPPSASGPMKPSPAPQRRSGFFVAQGFPAGIPVDRRLARSSCCACFNCRSARCGRCGAKSSIRRTRMYIAGWFPPQRGFLDQQGRHRSGPGRRLWTLRRARRGSAARGDAAALARPRCRAGGNRWPATIAAWWRSARRSCARSRAA